ncbi:hypothetical protein RM572_25070 [Streptomyces sp. DSM 42041]|uniref:Lipoprotein n=1 Tax=Streptomyces hazeniae TaxID=3075538 RepID=A0ABU2NYH3_9ACTN|nr:hypothetical protein [Streptomyces sp. DSM 42041]MDT0382040.1 hypothetical protein [Streptomyces sp. DSM 42041]
MRAFRKAVLATVSVAMAATLTACTGGEKSDDAGKAGEEKVSQQTDSRSAIAVMTASTRKTSEAKSAKVSMEMTLPGQAGGTMEMNGVMGWDPYAMDMTMTGGELAGAGGAGGSRVIWLDDAMYMDMGEAAAADMEGKRWMKIDLGAVAESAEDPEMAEAMTSGLDNLGQSPAQQMGMLLDSPNVKFAGEEKIDGVATRHYTGSLTIEEALKANKSLEVLEEKEREQLLDQLEASGIEEYRIEAWVNEEDLPVRIDVGMETPEGTVDMTQKMSDFGADVSVDAPPASETIDLMKMLEELQGAGSTAGAGTGM